MRELEHLLEATPFEARACTRRFTLAVADVGQIVWVPAIVAALHAKLPLARLRVVGIDALVSLGDLASPEIDLHLGLAGSGAGLHAEPLVMDSNRLVARRAHPIGRRPSLAALARLQHVGVDMVPNRRFADVFAHSFATAGVARDLVVTVPSYAAAAAIVRASDLVTMLPGSLQARDLRVLPLPFPTHVTKLSMSWHDRTHTDPAARAFRDIVRAAITG
jgi:DNA-binding transcriptional LysR family regulator